MQLSESYPGGPGGVGTKQMAEARGQRGPMKRAVGDGPDISDTVASELNIESVKVLFEEGSHGTLPPRGKGTQ